MSQNKHSEAQRRRTFKRVRGVILILLVVGLIVWGVTALIRRGAGKPDPTPDPNAGQQTEQPGGLPEPDPKPFSVAFSAAVRTATLSMSTPTASSAPSISAAMENEVQAQMKYNGYSREKAEQVAATRVAPPGTSEHNTGLAVDILSGDYYNHHSQIEESFEYDAEAAWMKAHCAEYGFILRYPKDKQDVTGIIFEPWHFRYVGVEIATYIMQNGLTLEEYLGVA